jgi:hypothetical protein
LRQVWQRLFARLVKQAFGAQFLLEDLKLPFQCAFAGKLDLFDDQLVVTACFIEADAPVGEYLVTILEVQHGAALPLAEKCCAHLCG